jgi:hypothetical protein
MNEPPFPDKAREFRIQPFRSLGTLASGVNRCFITRALSREEGRGFLLAECSPVRDVISDWNKWSRGERVLAIIVTAVLAALPVSLLLNLHPGG